MAYQLCQAEISHVLDISMSAASGGSLEDRGSGSTLVYTFFTSGTTGKPKGVMAHTLALCASRDDNYIRQIPDDAADLRWRTKDS